MKSFEHNHVLRQPLTPALLSTVRVIGEFKGKQDMWSERFPEVLKRLQEVAIIQSTESSNRIEGVTASPDRLRELMAQKTTPANRSEEEIAGYRDVLATIHASHEHVKVRPGVILQLHRDLYKFSAERGGQWKQVDNEIADVRPDGTRTTRFRCVPAVLTADWMERLCDDFNRLWQQEAVEPLLLIPAFVLDFLCIHPFRDGNGRMARLLTLLMLYEAGYEVGRYVSLERIIEESKESYYGALKASSEGWHEGQHSLRLGGITCWAPSWPRTGNWSGGRSWLRRPRGPNGRWFGTPSSTFSASLRIAGCARLSCPTVAGRRSARC